jgi:hypothetical protein
MKLRVYDVGFEAKTEKGKLYNLMHTEEVFTYGDETEAIQLAFKRVPLDLLRTPIVSAFARRREG